MFTSSSGAERNGGVIRVLRETDGIVAVCLEGEFDMANAPALGDQIDLALEDGNDVIVDLSEATFIDSSVIKVLFHGARAVDGRNQTLVLQVATAPIVERVLELVAVERMMPRVRSRTEAVQMIQRKAASA